VTISQRTNAQIWPAKLASVLRRSVLRRSGMKDRSGVRDRSATVRLAMIESSRS
jgi:hypothetical protein